MSRVLGGCDVHATPEHLTVRLWQTICAQWYCIIIRVVMSVWLPAGYYCISCLQDGLQFQDHSQLQVVDIAESTGLPVVQHHLELTKPDQGSLRCLP